MFRPITLGDIGEDQREYEFEPPTVPLEAPAEAPVQVPDREAVPA